MKAAELTKPQEAEVRERLTGRANEVQNCVGKQGEEAQGAQAKREAGGGVASKRRFTGRTTCEADFSKRSGKRNQGFVSKERPRFFNTGMLLSQKSRKKIESQKAIKEKPCARCCKASHRKAEAYKEREKSKVKGIKRSLARSVARLHIELKSSIKSLAREAQVKRAHKNKKEYETILRI